MTEHRYDDDEVHAIFARAANRQEEAEQAEAASKAGLTLTELQQIGAAAGIDAEHVADAARALALRGPGSAVTEPSNPWEILHSQVLPVPVSDRAWEQVVGELRRTFKKNGTISQFGDSREWSSSDEAGSTPIRLRIEPCAGGARVTLRRDAASEIKSGYVVGASLGSLTVALAVMTLAGLDVQSGGLLLGIFGVGTLLVLIGNKPLIKRWMAKQSNHFSAVTDRIELIVRRDTMLEGDTEE
jgi:hypothetical protein